MKIRKIIYAEKFNGMPKDSNFKFVDEDLGDKLNENEFFYKAIYISCDPYVRAYAPSYVVGKTVLPGYQLSKVVESRNKKYPVGTILVVNVGWQTGGKSSGSDVLYTRNDLPKGLPQSAGFGIFGLTGITAYYGVDRILKPKAGETLLVSGAAGAVGLIVGQIGKILGCRVIGSCGSDAKVKFVKLAGFDDAFNYKTEKVEAALKRLAPKGIDCYFDNVGGEFASTAISHMNIHGRIANCGAISGYNATETIKVSQVQGTMIRNSLRMEGFILRDFAPHSEEIYKALRKWAEEGKLKQHEYITEGFENLPSAFIGMLQGKNVGKTVVKM